MSGGMTAAGLVLLFLALIACAVGVYYAYVCLQSRPLRPKKHKDAEHGLLIPPDSDFNGNHEDVPVEASAPLEDDTTDKPEKPDPEESEQPPSAPPKDKEDVLIDVEEDASPASVAHETETTPKTTTTTATASAPLGFVVPVPMPAGNPQEGPGPLDHQPHPQPQPQSPPKPPRVESHPCSTAPVPLYIPPPQQKKPTTAMSDEEDGLLLQEPPKQPQDNTNTPHADASATLPAPHSSSQPEAPPQNSPSPSPEDPAVVAVVPNVASVNPEKEQVKPVGRAPEPMHVPSENMQNPSNTKEDIERFPLATAKVDPSEATPSMPTEESSSPKAPTDATPEEPVSEELKEAMPSPAKDSIAIENLPEGGETTAPREGEVPEEPRADSPHSVCSDELDHQPPHLTSPVVDIPPSLCSTAEGAKEEEEAGKDDIITPASPPIIEATAAAEEAPEKPLLHSSKEYLTTCAIVHSSADEEEDDDGGDGLSDTSTDDASLPPAVPSTTAKADDTKVGKESSEPVSPTPVIVAGEPMEGYTASPDDHSDADDSDDALPPVREEGGTDVHSEGTDTESSEPEVTEYSFSSGPSAPSTTGVLANEVSCTMEPKVTKIVLIDDAPASESDDSEISSEDEEETNIITPEDSEIEEEGKTATVTMPPPAPLAPAALTENPLNTGGETTTVSEQPDLSTPDLTSNGTAPNEPEKAPTPEPAAAAAVVDKNEESDSGHEESDTDSEGVEADKEHKEEIVSIPVVFNNTANNHITESPEPPLSNHNSDTPTPSHQTPPLTPASTSPPPSPPKVNLLKHVQGSGSSLEEIPKPSDEGDGLSVSTFESCDLSDGEVATSTPKKSMIPRLVKEREA